MSIMFRDNAASAELAEQFTAGVLQKKHFDTAILDRLCKQAVSKDQLSSRAATASLFGGIIEPFCDDFSTFGVNAANKVLLHLLHFVSNCPEGSQIKQLQEQHGFFNADDFLHRYERIIVPRPISAKTHQVRLLIFLSRVTAGADIAITSVIVKRAMRRWPDAYKIFIGPTHFKEMFDSLPYSSYLPFVYKNTGSLFEKMTTWPYLLQLIRGQIAGFSQEEVLLFDPDTRLTQLGLLPLFDEQSTCYFCSRRDQPEAYATKNLSALTNRWMDVITGETAECAPQIYLEEEKAFEHFCKSLRSQGAKRLVTINFGVGNDERKMINETFEEKVILRLLHDPHTAVILDSGRGDQELERSEHHKNIISQAGYPTQMVEELALTRSRPEFANGLIIFKGSLGSLGQMIRHSDHFIGYDSCGQHIAAATGTPSVIIFAGAPSEKFIRRWSPDNETTCTLPVQAKISDENQLDRLVEEIHQKIYTTLPNP